MGRQSEHPQSKGMEDAPVKELSEMEARKQSDTEFKRLDKRMLKELTAHCREPNGNYSCMKEEIETINKNQEEKNVISKIKNTLE